jgi:hypothetical protein
VTACREVSSWIQENVVTPVERVITEVREDAVTVTLLACLAGGIATGLNGPLGWHIAAYLAVAAFAGKDIGLAVARITLHRLESGVCARLAVTNQ